MGVPARAAVEAPEGGRAPIRRAAASDASAGANVCWCCAAHGWHAPFGASPPFLCRGRIDLWCVVVGRVRARRRAARTVLLARHCEHRRSNPDGLRGKLDCFVAGAPRNDERLSAPAQRSGAGEGGPHEVWWRGHAALRPTVRQSPLPPHFVRSPLPAARGGIRKGVTRIDTERKRGTRDAARAT